MEAKTPRSLMTLGRSGSTGAVFGRRGGEGGGGHERRQCDPGGRRAGAAVRRRGGGAGALRRAGLGLRRLGRTTAPSTLRRLSQRPAAHRRHLHRRSVTAAALQELPRQAVLVVPRARARTPRRLSTPSAGLQPGLPSVEPGRARLHDPLHARRPAPRRRRRLRQDVPRLPRDEHLDRRSGRQPAPQRRRDHAAADLRETVTTASTRVAQADARRQARARRATPA